MQLPIITQGQNLVKLYKKNVGR